MQVDDDGGEGVENNLSRCLNTYCRQTALGTKAATWPEALAGVGGDDPAASEYHI
jgi:hypothetical protein